MCYQKHNFNLCLSTRTIIVKLLARYFDPMIFTYLHFIFCLFIPQVRSSDATWSDTRRNLRKDHRWESASLLEREEKEKLFNEHVEALAKKKKEHFRQLLDETSMVRCKKNQEARKVPKAVSVGKVASHLQ